MKKKNVIGILDLGMHTRKTQENTKKYPSKICSKGVWKTEKPDLHKNIYVDNFSCFTSKRVKMANAYYSVIAKVGQRS